MAKHIVKSYDIELNRLVKHVNEMGEIAEKMLKLSTIALSTADRSLADEIVTIDKSLDQLHRTIEEQAVTLIAKRQPLAIDLREVISAIRLSNDIERIGDLTKNVAKRVITIAELLDPLKIVISVKHISDLVIEQLKDVLIAYNERSIEKAYIVWDGDDEVDSLYNSFFREMLTYMMEDPRNITFCTHLLFCAKNIERIGDHISNIAETIHYLVTGDNFFAERTRRKIKTL